MKVVPVQSFKEDVITTRYATSGEPKVEADEIAILNLITLLRSRDRSVGTESLILGTE